MKQHINRLASIIVFAIISAISLPAYAQVVATSEEEESISPERQAIINIEEGSEGNIEIDISDDMLDLIFSDYKPATKVNKGGSQKKKDRVSNSGYRVQVFGEAGNQGTLASRCRARGSMVLAKFPKYRGQMYIFSRSPNWYCRLGNFKTAGEAAKVASQIKRSFPQFAGEVRVVKSTIVNK